jgi:hypothetical protein
MGNLTPNPMKKNKTKVKVWWLEKLYRPREEKRVDPVTTKSSTKAKTRNMAPNWVQKNIKKAASTHLRVLA